MKLLILFLFIFFSSWVQICAQCNDYNIEIDKTNGTEVYEEATDRNFSFEVKMQNGDTLLFARTNAYFQRSSGPKEDSFTLLNTKVILVYKNGGIDTLKESISPIIDQKKTSNYSLNVNIQLKSIIDIHVIKNINLLKLEKIKIEIYSNLYIKDIDIKNSTTHYKNLSKKDQAIKDSLTKVTDDISKQVRIISSKYGEDSAMAFIEHTKPILKNLIKEITKVESKYMVIDYRYKYGLPIPQKRKLGYIIDDLALRKIEQTANCILQDFTL